MAVTMPCQEDVLDQCPPNASCDKGKCICLFGFKLNPGHHGKTATPLVPPLPSAASTISTNVASSAYCVLDESNNSQTSTTGNGDGSKNSNKPTADGTADDSGHAGQLPLREPAGAHHMLSGVLVPLAFVVLLIGSAMLAKRTQLWSRLRQRFLAHRNRHRRRPAYEDVVLVGFEPQAGGL
uniref:Uncharacterized protein n=1 Tax=Anopheles atroparvus TaxID=41427 RepID=A0A182J7T2_ANOAO